MAWRNLFARQHFLRTNESDANTDRPGFTILSVPNFQTDPRIDATRSEAAIIIDFEERLALVAQVMWLFSLAFQEPGKRACRLIQAAA